MYDENFRFSVMIPFILVDELPVLLDFGPIKNIAKHTWKKINDVHLENQSL
jgi:hypothetical protein